MREPTRLNFFASKCRLFFLYLVFYHVFGLWAMPLTEDSLESLYPGFVKRGSTVGQKKVVSLDSDHISGQRIFKFVSLPSYCRFGLLGDCTLLITTCSKQTNFDTVIYVYAKKAEGLYEAVDVNDNACGKQSALEICLRVGETFGILVTGFREAEGDFEIRTAIVDKAQSTPKTIPWGIDRTDQRKLPLDNKFTIIEGGAGVFVYVLDSGVRVSHSEFRNENNSSRAVFGVDIVNRKQYATDGTGHGTHVAGIIAGNSVGIAKKAVVVSVRVLNREGAGFTTKLIEGLEWALLDIKRFNRTPAIITMALSTTYSQALNGAVRAATLQGIPVITAAGNMNASSCSVSPSSETSAITVAATNIDDSPAEFSNYGSCIDIYAPGKDILSAWHTGDFATAILSGTSAACPHVAGAVATLLSDNPMLQPSEISAVLKTTATFSAVRKFSSDHKNSLSSESPELDNNSGLLYVRRVPAIIGGAVPDKQMMYVYVIVGVPAMPYQQSCELSRRMEYEILAAITEAIASKSITPEVHVNLCCFHEDTTGCDRGPESRLARLVIRLETKDHQAGAVYKHLTEFSSDVDKRVTIEAVLRSDIIILSEPWVVDSRGYKYSTAPFLVDTSPEATSTKQIIFISCITSCLFISSVLCIAYYLVLRRDKIRDSEKEEFEKYATDFETGMKDANNLTFDAQGATNEHRREGIKRANTDLFGDVLRNITAAAGLMTPRFFTGKTPRECGGTSTISSPFREPSTPGNEYRDERSTSPTMLNRFSRRITTSKLDSSAKVSGNPEVISVPEKDDSSVGKRTFNRSNRPTSSRGRLYVQASGRVMSFGPSQGVLIRNSPRSKSDSHSEEDLAMDKANVSQLEPHLQDRPP